MEYLAIIIVLVVATANTLLSHYDNKKRAEKLHSKLKVFEINTGEALKSVDENFDVFSEFIEKVELRHKKEDDVRHEFASLIVKKTKKTSPETKKKISESVKKSWKARKLGFTKKTKKSNKK